MSETTDKRQDQIAEAADDTDGKRTKRLYTRASPLETAKRWMESNTFLAAVLATLSTAVLITLIVTGAAGEIIDAIPAEGWSVLYYGFATFLVSVVPAWLGVRRWHQLRGTEVWDSDPVSNNHRHLRIGPRLWSDLRVFSPWGEEVSTGSLNEVTINGRSGFEVMDLRVTDGGQISCVATWMGEADRSMVRSYRHAVDYVERRLSKKAERAEALESLIEPIAREAAERRIMSLIRASERSSGMGGEQIEEIMTDVMEDFGVARSFGDDDLDLEGVETNARKARDLAVEQRQDRIKDGDGVDVPVDAEGER